MVMVVSEQGNGFPFAKWTCYESGLQSADREVAGGKREVRPMLWLNMWM